VGDAVATALLLTAAALPGASYPPESDWVVSTGDQLRLMLVFAIPAVLLLMTVARLSSEVRDARLAALRRLGLSRRQVRAVAAREGGWLAALGALGGTLAFLGLARWLNAAVALPAVFAAPAWALVLAPVGVIVAGMAVATAPTWGRDVPGGDRGPSLRERFHARLAARPRTSWLARELFRLTVRARPGEPRFRTARLALLGFGLVLLAVGAWPWPPGPDVDSEFDREAVLLFVFAGGAVLTAIGIALTTPVVTVWLARGLVRSRRAAPALAGRSIQAHGASASRVAAGLGLAVFAAVVIGGTSSVWSTGFGHGDVLRAFGDGPQIVYVYGPADIDAEDVAELARIRGVRGVVTTTLRTDRADGRSGWSDQGLAAVGTCEQLALTTDVEGCDDSRAARITFDPPYPSQFDVADGDTIQVRSWEPGKDAGPVATVKLSDQPITVNIRRSAVPYLIGPGTVAFVPVSLLPPELPLLGGVTLLADGGRAVQERVAAWGEPRGHQVLHVDEVQFREAQFARLSSGSLIAAVLGVALLAMALTSADRVRERRRSIARQLMAGVPRRVLGASQVIETALPTLVAAALGLGAGLLAVTATRGFAGPFGWSGLSAGFWVGIVAIVVAGVALATLASLPLAATKLRPNLLRRE
jgi:hypothetical protein